MRLCLITTFFPPHYFGGDGIFVAQLANALSRDGHKVEVIHCADAFQLTHGAVEPSPFALDASIRVHTLQSAWGALSPLLTFATGLPLLKKKQLTDILATGFDVIHWHNVSLIGGPGALSLGTGIKLCTLHEYWFTCPTHILFRDNDHACTTRACIRCQLAYKRPPQLWRYTSLMPEARRHIDRFLAPSRFVQELFRKAPDGFASTVLPHFVPVPQYVASMVEPERSYYLYVGRLEKAKGLQTIIPLFARTARRLIIAGAGTYEPELKRLCADAPTIEFRGRVAHSDLPDLYRGALATVIPSLCYETFGLVTVESLRYQTPVVSSNFGALPETIAATGGGLTYQDEADLERILDAWEADPRLAREMGCAGSRNLSEFEPRQHLDHYYRIIDEIRQSR